MPVYIYLCGHILATLEWLKIKHGKKVVSMKGAYLVEIYTEKNRKKTWKKSTFSLSVMTIRSAQALLMIRTWSELIIPAPDYYLCIKWIKQKVFKPSEL